VKSEAGHEVEWLTSLPDALAKAKHENKHVLIDFTGSDWCPPCKLLHKQVLTASEFETFASENLVLVELDFPRAKPQSDALKAANQELSQRFNIEGFPTVVMLDGDGKEKGRQVGYGGTDVNTYLSEVKSWMN
jgi:thiol:disulfide interchange protein